MSHTSLFEVARQRGWAWQDIADLTSPANPLGPPPGVRDAIRHAIGKVVHYPEPTPRLLLHRLADRWGVAPDQILPGRGATELIRFLANTWRKEASAVVVPADPETLRTHAVAKHLRWNEPYQWPDSGIVILERPNTQTGQVLDFDRLRVWLRATKNPVIVDERLIDCTEETSAITLLSERANLFILCSLSSLDGLPGLRIGALVAAPDAIAKLNEQREPWLIDVLAEAAALAALEDTAHAERARNVLVEERQWLWTELNKVPSATPVLGAGNFFLVYLASGAADLCRWLLDRKVLIEDCTGRPGIDGDAVRFSIGARPLNERLVRMLREYFCG